MELSFESLSPAPLKETKTVWSCLRRALELSSMVREEGPVVAPEASAKPEASPVGDVYPEASPKPDASPVGVVYPEASTGLPR